MKKMFSTKTLLKQYRFHAASRKPCLQRVFSTSLNNNKKNNRKYSNTQVFIGNASYFIMFALTGTAIYLTYQFKKGYVDPRKQLFNDDNKYSLDSKTRERMIKDMAKQFQPEMNFITNKNELINGNDLLSINNNKHFVLYFGYPSCNHKCKDILSMIIKCVKQNNKSIFCVYIDLNIYDSSQKLNDFLKEIDDEIDTENKNVIGLIPKDRETLRELIDSFYIYIKKVNHQENNENDENMKLNHSNMIYYIDCNGLLYDVSIDNHDDILNQQTINEKVYNLIHYSESTFLGKLQNTLSLAFQTSEMREAPNRFVSGEKSETH